MLVRLHVVIDKEDEDIEKRVKDKLSLLCTKFSYSPSREQPSLNGCIEWYATADLSDQEINDLLDVLNNDWDGDHYDCDAYGFNTKMFDENVYYLQFRFSYTYR